MTIIIRPYQVSDRSQLRQIFGTDEFARPKLLNKYPRFREYLADEMSYYPDYEPESLFIAQNNEKIVGALCGAMDTGKFEQIYQSQIRPMLIRRTLTGAYGWPGWLPAILLTEWAEREVHAPHVDRNTYPAHLHIGVLPEWRRQGIGSALMEQYSNYLMVKGIPGFHLFASSYHRMGVAFYEKLHLELLAEFPWRLHTGFEWIEVVERVYGKRLA